MRVVVTGGAGFIGSHVVSSLIDAGHTVLVIDDLSTGKEANIDSRAEFQQHDIREPAVALALAAWKPDALSHHAAQPSVVRSMEDPLFDIDVNFAGSVRLLRAAADAGIRHFVNISTCAVYGEPEELPVPEGHVILPDSGYGVSKFAFELYLRAHARHLGLGYTTLRYANVFGPRQEPHGEAGVVAIFLSRMLSGDRCTIYGDGEQARDFVYVQDCAHANVELLASRPINATYNVGTGVLTTISELHSAIAAIVGSDRSPIHARPRSGEIHRLSLDASRLQRDTKWRPTISLTDGLQMTASFFRSSAVSIDDEDRRF